MKGINELNQKYLSREGDRLAMEELLPVVTRYLQVKRPRILEIGCGYGRNLYALSFVKNSEVHGCDISPKQLAKARRKINGYKIKNVKIKHQPRPDKLPYRDNQFDLVVVWQVLEHIFSKHAKQALLNEVTRVVKPGGLVLVETPNFWFPFDYHDNNLPLVHWLLPDSLRHKINTKIRHEDFPPSQYTNIFELRKMLKRSPHSQSVKQLSRIYFEDNYLDIFRHLGGTRLKFKKLFFSLYAPEYLALRLMHLPGDLFTPSLRVVYKINKRL